MSEPQRKRPSSDDWHCDEVHANYTRWTHRTGIVVTSSVDEPDPEIGPEWHVGVSCNGVRAGRGAIRRALRDFDMLESSEDNHVRGVARHFWLAVNPSKRAPCECADEPAELTPFGPSDERGDVFVYREERPR